MKRNLSYVIVALAGPLLAQKAQEKPPEFPLESVRVTGNRQIPAGRVVEASGLKIGRVVEKQDFDAARERLVKTGAFENVGYEYKPAADGRGYDAVIEVVEVNELFPYRFEDVPAKEDALRVVIRKVEPIFEDRIPATAAMLDRYSKAIEQFVVDNGSSTFPVAGRLNSDLPGGLAVLFRPATPRTHVAEVRFTGNDAVPTALLLRSISPVAVGIPYTEREMRQRLDAAIRPLYDARGRIRVSFPTVATERDSKVDGLVVTVSVSEGAIYNLGAVRFTGVPSGDTAALEKLADLKAGDIVNFDDVKAALDRVHKRYRNSGYLRVSSTVGRDIHDDKHTVDLAVAVELGPQYHFGKLDISGLDILSEPAIRKMWGSLEGKAFNPEFPDSFLARIREEGILDNLGNTRSETKIDEGSKTVDVTLYFKGAAPQPVNRRRDPAPVAEPPPIWLRPASPAEGGL